MMVIGIDTIYMVWYHENQTSKIIFCKWQTITISVPVIKQTPEDSLSSLKHLYDFDRKNIYIVECQRGGVSDESPWPRAATRHGPGTL